MNDTLTWLERCREHCSDPCYAGAQYNDLEMLDELLGTVEHGYQHEACQIKFNVDRTALVVEGLVLVSDEPIIIPLQDLAEYGYVPDANQTAIEFVQEHWNYY